MHNFRLATGLFLATCLLSTACAPTPARPQAGPWNSRAASSTRLPIHQTLLDPQQDCTRFSRLLTDGPPLLNPALRPNTIPSITDASMRAAVDERFVPIFGRPLDQLTDRDFDAATYQSLPYCLNGVDAPLGKTDEWQKQVLRNVFNRTAFYKRYAATARQQAQVLDDMSADLRSLPATEDGLKQLADLESRGRNIEKDNPGVRADQFEAACLEAEHRVGPGAQRMRMERLIAGAKGFGDVNNLLDTKQDFENLGAQSKDPMVKSALAGYVQVLSRRISELEAQRAGEELRLYESFAAAAPGDLETMVEAKRRELKLKQTYAAVLDVPEFKPFNDKRQTYRDQLLTRNTPALSAKVMKVESGSEIGEVFDTYVVQDDQRSAAAVPLRAAAAKRTLVMEPFTGLSGDVYLNAVYGGDWDTVRYLDKAYLSGMTRLAEQTGIAGALLKPLLAKASLIAPVLRAYLFQYDSHYAKCIGPGAVTFTVTSRADIVTKNSVGLEVSRQFGNPQSSKYIVNKEFGEALGELGNEGDSTAGTMFGDSLMNGGKAGQVLAGTVEMMEKFKCDDPRIKRMERNLLSIYEKYRDL